MRLYFFDAKPHFDTDPVRSLMSSALAFPNDEMLDRLLQRYHDDDDMQLLGAMDDQENLQGLIGLRMDEAGKATFLHLRVQDDVQRSGIGSSLVRKAIAINKLAVLSGRSPQRLLPFFEKLGFTNWVVGEKPRGTLWYGVRWETAAVPPET